MSDFFSRSGPVVQDATDNQAAFAEALRVRYGPDGIQLVKGRELFSPSALADSATNGNIGMPPAPGSMTHPLPRMPSTLPKLPSALLTLPTTAPAASTPSSEHTFQPTKAEDLSSLSSDSNAIIIDLRSHAQFANARLPRAVSLAVPSTLLKRPAFALSKVSDMLPAHARSKLLQWPTASRIVLYDADGAPPAPGSNIMGLLRKFIAEGCPPSKLSWLDGGFQNVWRHHRELVDSDPPSEDDDDEAPPAHDEESSPRVGRAGLLQARQLPAAAFTTLSTTGSKGPFASSSGSNAPQRAPQVAFNPFYDAIRQNLELSQGITERINLRLEPRVLKRADDLPFQWLRDIAHHAGEYRPRTTSVDSRHLDSAIDEGAESLAMQFYRIELAEQRRLTGIMQHHSQHDSGVRKAAESTEAQPFPYSITAGVEKGAKNRYRNIWPFEHSRVHLHPQKGNEDDYINASYIQPLGTDQRYIATQGPLPATFNDFWALVWEQNVHILVMLTREIEGSMVKCGRYWAEGTYGPIRLRLISTTGGTPIDDTSVSKPSTGPVGFFTNPEAPQTSGPSTIRRTFELTHTRYADTKPRIVTQFQYLDWPDMNVPNSPAGLLELIKSVRQTAADVNMDRRDELYRASIDSAWDGPDDDQVCQHTGVARHALGNRPVLLHCSAGVGRTGGFIAVDAVLDGIRRELADKAESSMSSVSDSNDMAVDSADDLENEPHSTVDVDAPMDLDAPGTLRGASGQRQDVKKGIQRTASPRKSRRSSAGSAWAKNDPRKTPLRKWLVATSEASARETQVTAESNIAAPSPMPAPVPIVPSSAAPTPTHSAQSSQSQSSTSSSPPFPLMVQAADESKPNSPLLPAFRLSPDSAQRTRASSAPSRSAGSTARQLATHLHISGPDSSETFSASTNSFPDDPSALFSSSEGRSSKTSLLSPPRPSSQQAKSLLVQQSQSPPVSPAATFDYTAPRALHTQGKPCALSSLSEPVRAVIEDIREQRMSLCQSLRQYVFVHQAIVEGALDIVDELRAAGARAKMDKAVHTAPATPNKAKRRHSIMDADTAYDQTQAGAVLTKRPSIKRVNDPTSHSPTRPRA